MDESAPFKIVGYENGIPIKRFPAGAHGPLFLRRQEQRRNRVETRRRQNHGKPAQSGILNVDGPNYLMYQARQARKAIARINAQSATRGETAKTRAR